MTSPNTTYVNGDRIRARLLELEMSERDLGRRTGIGGGAIRALLRTNQVHTSLTVAHLQALGRETGLTVSQMLTPDQQPAPAEDSDEMACRLVAVLLHERRLIPWDHLVEAFSWTNANLRQAARTANQRLQGTGLRIHTAPSGVTLRPEDQSVSEVITTVDRLRTRRNGMDYATARILHQVITGTIGQRNINKGHGPRLNYLRNQGMVLIGGSRNGFIAPSENVLFAFDV